MALDYKRSFYAQMAGDVPLSAAEVVPLVLAVVRPRSIVDVGCGTGAWLAEFQRHGIDDVYGLDGPWVDPQLLQIPLERFRVVDVGTPLDLDRRFDLVMCLETAEHLRPDSASILVNSLVSLGSVVLFSAAIPFQGGYNHLNEQWPEYWAQLFAEHGFVFVDAIRPQIWSNPRVEWWYAQNMFIVANAEHVSQYPLLAEAIGRTRQDQLAIVHPRAYIENSARTKSAGQLFQATLGALKRSVMRRVRS